MTLILRNRPKVCPNNLIKKEGRMLNKIVCKFYLRTDAKCSSTGEFPIYANININGIREKKHTGIFIEEKFWDVKNRQVKNNCTSSDEYNATLNDFKARINKISSDANLEKLILSKTAFNKRLEVQSITGDFLDYIKAQAETRPKIKPGTRASHKNTAVLLRSYQGSLQFADITQPLMFNLITKMQRDSYSDNYIQSTVKNVKTYWNLIQKQTGIKLNYNPFEDLGTHWVKGNKAFLTVEELQAAANHFIEIKDDENYLMKYKHTLMYFLFSCYTGLRISDAGKLRQAVLVNSTLKFTPTKQKMGKEKEKEIPLSKDALYLFQLLQSLNFPYVADATKNKFLKVLGVKLKIRKQLKYHSSRHTFITTLLIKDAPIAVVQELAGHADMKTTLEYAHILQRDMKRAVGLLDNL